jgi:hypothetical protein
MAPNLALSQHVLIQSIIESKLQGEEAPTDKLTAKLATCSLRAVRRYRSKAPSNGSGRPKIITPHMLTTLHDQLSIRPFYAIQGYGYFSL